MAKRFSLAALLAGTLAIAAAYASSLLPGGAPGWAAWAMAVGISTVMVASMALGAARNGKIGKLKLPFALCFLILAGGFMTVLALPESADATKVLGLPLRSAIVLLGIGLLPLVVLPVAYALTFEEMTLDDADLERIRQVAQQVKAASAAASTHSTASAHPAPVDLADSRIARAAEVEAV